jgi:hypothetical protein
MQWPQTAIRKDSNQTHAGGLKRPCLVQGYGHAGRVDQVQRVVEVAGLAVDLACGAGAARHVHQLRAADVQHPLPLGCSTDSTTEPCRGLSLC